MDWIEVEHNISRTRTLVLAGITCAAGIGTWWLVDACWGLLAYFFVLSILAALFLNAPSFNLPADARPAVESALEAFAARYPNDKVTSAAIRAVEADRIVVSVRYGMGRPGPRRYFAVSRPQLDTVTELDTREWWPRGLR